MNAGFDHGTRVFSVTNPRSRLPSRPDDHNTRTLTNVQKPRQSSLLHVIVMMVHSPTTPFLDEALVPNAGPTHGAARAHLDPLMTMVNHHVSALLCFLSQTTTAAWWASKLGRSLVSTTSGYAQKIVPTLQNHTPEATACFG